MAFGGLSVEAQLGGEVFGPPAIKLTHLGLFPRGLDGCIPTDWPDPYVSGESPFVYSAVFEGRQIPDIWMPLKDAIAMYWRVKKWKWSVSMTWAEIDGSVATYSFNEEREVWAGGLSFLNKEENTIISDIESEEPTTDERSLVCGLPTPEVTELIYFDEGDPVEVTSFSRAHFAASIGEIWTATGGDQQGESLDIGRAYIRWGGELGDIPGLTALPYPPAYARKNQQDKWEYMPTPVVTFNVGAAGRWDIRVFPDLSGEEEAYGTMTYKFLDKTYDCPIYATNQSANDPDFTNTLSIDATLEAMEYWPYDPGDGGGPIYSAKFGEKLR
jgi:hypothetical protein